MQKFTGLIFEENGWHIAQCVELDIASQGNTAQEAFDNLQEAMTLHLQAPSSRDTTKAFADSIEDARKIYPAAKLVQWDQNDG